MSSLRKTNNRRSHSQAGPEPLGQAEAEAHGRGGPAAGEPWTCARCCEPAPFAPVTLTIHGDTKHYHTACWVEFLSTHTPPSEGRSSGSSRRPAFPAHSNSHARGGLAGRLVQPFPVSA